MKTQQAELEFTPILPEPRELGIHARFVKFHYNNPEVYNNIVRLAREFRSRSFNLNRKMSISMLFEVLRWNYFIEVDQGEEEFKLSNDFRAPYARLIMQQEQDLTDAFNTRTSVVD
jgi:hypothetical protein